MDRPHAGRGPPGAGHVPLRASDSDHQRHREGLRGAAQSAAWNAEKALIEKALRESGGNRTRAARALGVSRKTLFNKMKALGIRD